MRNFISAVLIVGVSLLLVLSESGCYYDVEDELYPPTSSCDTLARSYATHIAPLVQSQCLGCHSQAARLGNVNLEGYTALRLYALDGRLMGTIRHAQGFSPMPKGGNKFTACQIAQVQSWIHLGAPDN